MLGSFHKHESNLLRRRRCKVSIDDFREIDQLGVGGFGEVKLVRSAEDAQLYAMKVLNKRHILKKNQVSCWIYSIGIEETNFDYVLLK